MVFQRRRGSTKDYTFRGKSTEQGDSLAIPLQYGTDNLVLWVRHAPPKKGPAQSQEIRTSGSWSLLGPKRAFGSEPRTGVPEAGEPSTEETGMPADKQTQPPSTATADATNKRAADASEPLAKRVAGSQRALPEGAIVDHVEKDGNCLFSCLAKGINMLAPDGRQLTGGEVRARIAVHLRKNEEAYVKGWDHEMPDRTKAADWGSYVTAIEGDKVWGGLTEIKAACRVWDIRCIVFPTSEHLEPFQVHGQAKRRVVGLYFTGHHYDLFAWRGRDPSPQHPRHPGCTSGCSCSWRRRSGRWWLCVDALFAAHLPFNDLGVDGWLWQGLGFSGIVGSRTWASGWE